MMISGEDFVELCAWLVTLIVVCAAVAIGVWFAKPYLSQPAGKPTGWGLSGPVVQAPAFSGS